MAHDGIATLRGRFAGCEIVMLADLSTMTVLAADSAIRPGQEHLDRLCETAAAVFAPDACTGIGTARLSGATGTRVFVRAGPDTPEVICGVFAPGAALDGFSSAARALVESTPDELTPEEVANA